MFEIHVEVNVATEEFRFMKKGQVTKRIQGWMC